MKFSTLILVTGYLLLSSGSSPVQTQDCYCQESFQGEKYKTISIRLTREDVVSVNCSEKDPFTSTNFGWKAMDESKPVEKKTVSRFIQKLTIRGSSIHMSQSQFKCIRTSGQSRTCCTVIANILPSSTPAMKKFSVTSQQERQRSHIPSATATPKINSQAAFNASTSSATLTFTNHLNGTSFPNVSSIAFNSFQTVTISATVSVIAVLFLGVGAAAVIIALKRKRISDGVTANDSSDNLDYLLDVKQQQVWSGNEIIPIDCLLIGKSLGEGQFGTVAEGKLRTMCKKGIVDDKRVAIKMLKNREGVNPEELRKEAKIIVKLGQHQNVIYVYGYCMEKKCLSKIVMEYAELGDLHRHLRKIRSLGLKDAEQFAFSKQIAEGMKFFASKGCVHRDLAARNVLVCAGQRLKISDFGLAKDLQSAAYYRKTSRGGVIPFRWCAPEVLLYATYSEYSDVWSYGIVLWEIATVGGTPYPGIPVEQLFELLTGKSGYRMSKPRNCSQKLYDIMVSCWSSVPDLRPTFLRITSEIM